MRHSKLHTAVRSAAIQPLESRRLLAFTAYTIDSSLSRLEASGFIVNESQGIFNDMNVSSSDERRRKLAALEEILKTGFRAPSGETTDQ